MGAYFFLKMLAVAVADRFTLFAHRYQRMPALICPAYLFSLARLSVFTGIMRVAPVPCILLHRVVPDLLGNGRPVSSHFSPICVNVRCFFSSVSPAGPHSLKILPSSLSFPRRLSCFHNKTGRTSLLLLLLYRHFLYDVLFCLYLAFPLGRESRITIEGVNCG